jgi:pyridoxal phosphate enzyme (YggS family)
MPPITTNLSTVRRRITEAAVKTGRDPAAIKLVAVSKTKNETDIIAATEAGQKIFGENRVQEAKTKFVPLRARYPDLRLHLIGPLQTNKAEEAVKLFDVIEVLDRPRLAAELARAIKKTGAAPEFYIEINIGEEPQKAGIAPETLGDFIAFCRDACGLKITGLMAIPPQHENPAPYFARLRELAARHNLPNLSMGMSGDFEAAIAAGSTEIRIGTAIFGARHA